MNSRAFLGLSISFTSATPDLLPRFRHKLDAASQLSSWQRSQYTLWVSEFVEYFAGRTLSSVKSDEMARFLARLESRYHVGDSGQKEVLGALRFLYQEIDGVEPPWSRQVQQEAKRTSRGQHFAGLSRATLRTVLPLVEYQCQLPVALIYGAGLKPSECSQIRVGDVDLEKARLTVRNSQGLPSHETVLPRVLLQALSSHLDQRRQTHMKDSGQSFAGAPVPSAMAKDGEPYARSWRCQFFFADGQLSPLGDGRYIRREVNPRRFERAIRMAADRVELGETVTDKSLRLSFARHLIQQAVDPIVLQYVLGQAKTLPASHQEPFERLQSPMDELWAEGHNPWRN